MSASSVMSRIKVRRQLHNVKACVVIVNILSRALILAPKIYDHFFM